MSARTAYEQGRDRHAGTLRALESRSRAFGASRLVLVAIAIGLVLGIIWGGFAGWGWAGLAAVFAVFAGFVVAHARVHAAEQRAAAGLRFHERGLARLALAWDRLPAASARFRVPDHPFAADLDVFGRASLMQIVDATETRFGEERLASLLALESRERAAAWATDVSSRQDAARDLAARFAFRETLATSGAVLSDERPDPTLLLAWAESATAPAASAGLTVLAWGLPAVAIAALAVGSALGISTGILTVIEIAVIVLGLRFGMGLTPMLEAVSSREGSVTRWRAMISVIEAEAVTAPLLAALRARLTGVGGASSASIEIARLERIVSFADARRNEVFRFVIGPLLMWDVHCALALERWRARSGARLRGWLSALGEVEALASLGSFAFEHPDFVWPELDPEPKVEARGLGHPLIAPERRVGNDVGLPAAGFALVVTGSNMSGKSTLLRAIGANVVLANAGAPVCAAALRLGPVRVATSMRVEDSLEQGVSHFFAELRRLKRVLDLAREPGQAPVLFLLDEILHGTNSRERIIGACAVVRELLALGALGGVSTHDLGITALERELKGRVENAHLEEQVAGDVMTFDYVLRPGIVHSSNALRLMRAVGIEVADVADAAEANDPAEIA